jgi:S1-C subfamily serine protease
MRSLLFIGMLILSTQAMAGPTVPPCPCPGPCPQRILPTVRVESSEPRGVKSLGSGVCVANTQGSLILTAWHVVKDGNKYNIRTTMKQDLNPAIEAKLIKVDKVWDIAALTVSEKIPTVKIATSNPKIGETLILCGFGSGKYESKQGSVFMYFHPGNDTTDWLAITTSARPGDSGGGMFNRQGNLAAITFGSDKLGAHGTCCTRLRTFIQSLDIPNDLKQQALTNE